jgi:hypothetical protein
MPSLARASYVLATWLNKEYWLDEPDKQPARPRQSALSAKRGAFWNGALSSVQNPCACATGNQGSLYREILVCRFSHQ